MVVIVVCALVIMIAPQTAFADCTPNGGSGNDNITCGGVDADGINGGFGNDTIVIQDGAAINGVIDGGGGSDTLIFSHTGLSDTESAQLNAIAASNPATGFVILKGQLYVWANMEDVQIGGAAAAPSGPTNPGILLVGRINPGDIMASAAVGCTAAGGVAVHDVNPVTTNGTFAFHATPQEIISAIQSAVTTGQNTLINQSLLGNTLWALTSGELQVNGFDIGEGILYEFTFPTAMCGLYVDLTGITPGYTPPQQPITTPTYTQYPTYTATYTPTNVAGLLPGERLHVVLPGQNLFRISLFYGVSMGSVAARNGITNINLIYAGQTLIIPVQ
jgi:hypothetical protein